MQNVIQSIYLHLYLHVNNALYWFHVGNKAIRRVHPANKRALFNR